MVERKFERPYRVQYAETFVKQGFVWASSQAEAIERMRDGDDSFITADDLGPQGDEHSWEARAFDYYAPGLNKRPRGLNAINCPNCDGSGSTLFTKVCPRCEGRGWIVTQLANMPKGEDHA